MIYSDRDILRAMRDGSLDISPFHEEYLQPASYDVHLYPIVLQLQTHYPIDLNRLDDTTWIDVEIPTKGLAIWPDMFVLMSTIERISLSDRMVCVIDGSSTLSRSGLTVHQTGQWVDPGFTGTLTFECKCTNGVGIIIYPNMKLGQLIFANTHTSAKHPYTGRYQNQLGPQRPREKR